MAGSSTQSMENFTSQGMERHQMMTNTEVMKHLRIMNRASVREIMLQHEKTFKEQVHDLHKLYEVQRLLMDKAKSRGRDAYVGGPPPSPGRGTLMSEDNNQGQRNNFWEQATPDGMGTVKGGASAHTMGSPLKAIPDRIIKIEETPKIASSPVRKRKIDLEQLPEDDSDDEIDDSANTLNPTTSSLSGNSRELPKAYPGFEALVKAGHGPHGVSSLQPFSPVKHSQVTSFLTGESSFYNGQNDGSTGDYHGKALPSLPMKPEQNLTKYSERNMTFQNANMLNTGVGSVKNSNMFLPQPDLIDRASQETGRQATWYFQAPEANIVNTSARIPAHQQQSQSPHLALPEHSTSRNHPPPPHLEQRHINNSPSIESVGSIIGKASLERLSPGIPTGAHTKDTSGASAERLGDTSKWFTKESFPQASVVPMARFDAGVTAGGGYAMPAVVTPANTLASSKGPSHERDMSLWSSQNPILQLPQYQQPPVFQQQVLPPSSQPLWVQSSQNAQSSIYPQQQVVYGLHTSDPSQIGYRGEPLQRNQGDIAGPWNMIGLGHYYPSIPSTPQKPPFKKPPKLVLKNDGVGMELKLVSPEKEMTEKERAIQKKPLSVLKRDSLQTSSKSCENNSGGQKDVGEEDVKLGKKIPSSTGEAKEHLKTVGAPIEPKILATASSSSTLTLSQGASNSIMLPSVAQRNLGTLACTSGTETGSGFNVFASPNESILQQGVSQSETICPSSEPEKMVEQRILSLKSSHVAFEKEPLPLTDNGMKDMQAQMEGGGPSEGEIDINSGLEAVQERKEPSDKKLTSEGNGIDVVASSQSESLNMTLQGVQSKCEAEGVVPANVVQQRARKLEEDKGSLSERRAEGHHKDSFESKASHNADSMHPSSQPVMQAVSLQSASTDTPSTTRQEKKRSSKLVDNNLSQRVSARISTACKNESGSSLSDRDCASAPSLNTIMSESKSEAIVGVLNEDLQHDSDSDNLAASILLSFAPKLDLLNEEKQLKESASEISSSMCKVRTPGQGSKTFRSPEARMGSHSVNWNAGGIQGRKMQNNPGSTRRMDRMDHHDHSKVPLKDRHRREEMNFTERRTDEGDVVPKSLTIKLPRVATSTSNGEAIPISRSKQLSKLNGVTLSGNPVESVKNFHKGNEAVHTPTGRRSSRGPPMGARAPPESRSRLHHQTQHRVEYSPPHQEKDSGIREEGGRSINKLDGNMKSKAWGELNRTRSHPRKQFPEMSHRKTQK